MGETIIFTLIVFLISVLAPEATPRYPSLQSSIGVDHAYILSTQGAET